ncbi:MAG: phosphoribosylanthranilate isomerase [Candidatus Syntrophoarchaeum caldarius]|uniref:N-(5'-phosphoribosyl)anthranilate isomerase n=1 Tax=Candidatus Syntropharchaeum caldarium TaxID=1838285 RepID=A0A1F2PAI0_9EURY|nr:MAG: phosphoribosylanthranilate isomerase [Candidatus Syntrophoarchaeum caldarius]
MTFVKICGIKTRKDLEVVIGASPDAAGFIVEVPVKTPRKIRRETAASLVASVPEEILSVAVLMPESVDEAVSILDTVRPDMAQIHCEMDVDALARIKEETGVDLIKVIGIDADTDPYKLISDLCEMDGIVDFILLDTKTALKSGGTGKVHDWSISRVITERSPIPVILAGGLDHLNVADAIKTVEPFGVDTASGVETGGSKDPEKVKKFVTAAKRFSD